MKSKKYMWVIIILFVFFILIAGGFISGYLYEGEIEPKICNVEKEVNIFGKSATSLNYTIDISDEIKNIIISEYSENIENPYCFNGDYNGTVWVMNKVLAPTIYYQNDKNTSFSCPKETMMMLHTHPHKTCKFSPADIFSFGVKSGYLFLDGIYCGTGFVVIDKHMNQYEVI